MREERTMGAEKTRMERVIPGLSWIREYQLGFLPRDLAGGLAVGSMLIPQGLAFAQIVQVPAVAGLWSGIAAMTAYALFGPSRNLMVGPEAGTAIMVASFITTAGMDAPDERLAAAAMVALMVAAILLIAGLFRLGAIADFLSRPILVGYMNGIAVVLIASQLGGVFGIQVKAPDLFPGLMELFSKLGQLHRPTLLLSLPGLALLLALRRAVPNLPGPVVLVTAGIVLSALLGFEERGIRVLGVIEPALPTFGIPRLRGSTVMHLAPGALSLALLIYASSVLSSRIFADKNRYDFKANKEFFGMAAANLLCALIQGVPAAGSDTRTVINDAAKTRTQAAGLIASAMVVGVIFLLGPVMALLPNALLSAVVISSAISLFDLRGFVRIWRVRASEGGLAVATFVGVLALGILPGVLVAVALAVADLVRRAAHPNGAVLGWREGQPGYRDIEHHPGSATLPGLIVYRLDAPLFFANARFLREQVHKLVESATEPVRMVVLDCGAMFDLDVTAAEMLEQMDREFDGRGIILALAEPHAPMRRVLGRTGLLEKLGEKHIFATVGEAVSAYKRTAGMEGRLPG